VSPTTQQDKPAAAPKPAVTKEQLAAAIERATKAVASQPKRTEKEGLTQKQKDEAFALGKAIAADQYRLGRAQAGKTAKETVDAMVKRIVDNVTARNKLRKK
jgi:hypothetical protein